MPGGPCECLSLSTEALRGMICNPFWEAIATRVEAIAIRLEGKWLTSQDFEQQAKPLEPPLNTFTIALFSMCPGG